MISQYIPIISAYQYIGHTLIDLCGNKINYCVPILLFLMCLKLKSTYSYSYQESGCKKWSTCRLRRRLLRHPLLPLLPLTPAPLLPLPPISSGRRRTLSRPGKWPSLWVDAEMYWSCTTRGGFMQWTCAATVSSSCVDVLLSMLISCLKHWFRNTFCL